MDCVIDSQSSCLAFGLSSSFIEDPIILGLFLPPLKRRDALNDPGSSSTSCSISSSLVLPFLRQEITNMVTFSDLLPTLFWLLVILFPFQIQFLLLFSRQGKLRLQKWFTAQTEKQKKKMARELIANILTRLACCLYTVPVTQSALFLLNLAPGSQRCPPSWSSRISRSSTRGEREKETLLKQV